jgi:predicted transposase/invertase (TIGR01784 family)
MPNKIKTPHDTYFQNMMEKLDVAYSFFMAHLYHQVAEELDWNTLQIADSVRREPNSKSSYTDITYICYTKLQNIPIYLHVEQERNVDPLILERILKYNLRLFAKHRQQKKEKLPIIVNFVLYNGRKRKSYPYHESIYDYFSIPWMAKLLMEKSFFLINLNHEEDVLLSTHGNSSMMELLLKRASDSNFIPWMKENRKLVQSIPVEGILSESVDYTLQVGQGKAEEIIELFTEFFPQFKHTIMTAARQLERRGEIKGRQESKLAIAKNMLLKLRLDIDTVQRATELTKEELQQIFKEGTKI